MSDRARPDLHALKLRALVRDHTGDADSAASEPTNEFALGAALMTGETAWVLIADGADDGRGLGAALIWARRRSAASLNVVAAAGAAVMARRAGQFDLPVEVFETVGADGRALGRVAAAPVEPPRQPPAEHLALVPTIAASGATPAVEHGAVVGEVRGLEVCRVTDGEDGRPRLEVGVGIHDREAFAMIHGDIPAPEALAGVVAAVAAVRGADAPPHPLNRLAAERLLRWRLEQQPWLVGMASVHPAEPPVPRANLKDRVPCTAIGERIDGSSAVIVCSVGVDLDVIPYAADARLAAGGDGELIVVAPSRDLLAVTHELAAGLGDSPTLVAVD